MVVVREYYFLHDYGRKVYEDVFFGSILKRIDSSK